MATSQGLINRDLSLNERNLNPPPSHAMRPLLLTRSWFTGTQKYSQVWTADSEAEWKYL